MSDYPRRDKRETTQGISKEKVGNISSSEAEADDKEERKPPKVRIPIKGGKRGAFGGEEVEWKEVDVETAQHWDERIWNGGDAGSQPHWYRRG
ncbi:MAG TPA: hypothetical protein VFV01_29340 [Spirillospora sp.]|nr:hypothetical protein [Spirillospora sp.]